MADGSGLSVPPIRPDGLQLQEDRDRQIRYWRVQRLAWWGFGAIMLAALLGLTGSGGLFHQQTIRFAKATIEIPRVSRWEGSDAMTVTFHAASDRHELTLSQPFFNRFMIERIQPEPEQGSLVTGAQSLVFPADGAPPHHVTIGLRAKDFGHTRFDMTIDGETRPIALIVLP